MGEAAEPGLLMYLLVLQMIVYLTFPVAMFWISNQADWFESYVVQRKVGIRRALTGSF